MRWATAAIVFVTFLAAEAQAWSDAGHKIIASIAFRQLNADQRAAIVELLAHHPRHAQDFRSAMPADVAAGPAELCDEWLFQQAAIWPDLARGFPEAEKERFHRPTWHYINRPLFLTDRDRDRLHDRIEINLKLDPSEGPSDTFNVVQALRQAWRIAADPRADRSQRALMLTWIFHTVGDVHQPLHSTALFAEGLFPDGDRGGNLIRTGQRSNLHAVWDSLPGGRLKVTEARNRAIALLQASESERPGEEVAGNLDEHDWVSESHSACRDFVYTPEVLAHLRRLPRDGGAEALPLVLSEEYLKSAGAVAVRRVVTAGRRLGSVLKQVANADRPAKN